MPERFLPPHGGYRSLLSFQKSEIIFDGTGLFCARFLDKKDRTCDQMIQAARSGKQNIAEASQASGASKETELKLTSVARASLEELLLDYEDFLRTRRFARWDKDSKKALYVRRLSSGKAASSSEPVGFEAFRSILETRPADVVANIMICLIHQANYLLDKQLRGLEKDLPVTSRLRESSEKSRLEAHARQAFYPHFSSPK